MDLSGSQPRTTEAKQTETIPQDLKIFKGKIVQKELNQSKLFQMKMQGERNCIPWVTSVTVQSKLPSSNTEPTKRYAHTRRQAGRQGGREGEREFKT